MRVLDDGSIAITDPNPNALPLIRSFDPNFEVRTQGLPDFVRPRLIATRQRGSGIGTELLPHLPDDHLWSAHDEVKGRELAAPAEATMLDVKIELARRMLLSCRLCGLRCDVNRIRGERGRCGLDDAAYVYEAYTHIAEEPFINPAMNVSLRGCGMRCIFCQQAAALDPHGQPAERLVPQLWKVLDFHVARSLVFVGGNPSESLPAILTFLEAAPTEFSLPIGWNCSGYDSVDAIRLLDGVCDVYVPDFKYGNDTCAVNLSDASGYVENASSVVAEMLRQEAPVIVRIVVLPGHETCCHMEVLAKLATQSGRQRLYVSLQGTYLPEWKATNAGALAHRPTSEAVASVRRFALQLGLQVVD